jgi:hypothetical protein
VFAATEGRILSKFKRQVTLGKIDRKLKRFDCKWKLITRPCRFTGAMDTNAHAEFLRRQGTTLRQLAQRSPQIAEALRRLAAQLEEIADEVEGKARSTEN